MKKDKNIPGGMVLDILNRISKCLAHACVEANADPNTDCYWTFDTHYSSVKPDATVQLTICVRADRPLAKEFYAALDNHIFAQYGVHSTLVTEQAYPTKIMGNAYSLSANPIPALWRSYTLKRDEDVSPVVEE